MFLRDEMLVKLIIFIIISVENVMTLQKKET